MKMTPRSIEQMRQNATAAEDLLKSLANANRLMVLCHLVNGERNVGELEQLVGLSQSSLSQHLAKLKEQGIVTSRKEGTTVFYRLRSDQAVRVLELLHRLYCP